MRKSIICAIIALCFAMNINPDSFSAQRPDYEKYGNIAIAVVKADYPGDEVREYTYMGRKKISPTDVTDSFQFEVTENGKSINVIVRITHNINNKKLLTLSVGELKP